MAEIQFDFADETRKLLQEGRFSIRKKDDPKGKNQNGKYPPSAKTLNVA
jgi:hypothetical protein